VSDDEPASILDQEAAAISRRKASASLRSFDRRIGGKALISAHR
jgi:hypothetical protein